MSYIGGDRSWQKRQPFLRRMREKGEKISVPFSKTRWKLQCVCGNFKTFYRYRNRTYCGVCGRKTNISPVTSPGKP